LNAIVAWVHIAPFGAPVVPEVEHSTAASPEPGSAGAGLRPSYWLKISPRSSVPAGRSRCAPANSRSSLRDCSSSGEQVITVLTAVSPVAMTSLATDS
jgi:hypothetical protein